MRVAALGKAATDDRRIRVNLETLDELSNLYQK
jgi:hypothetical protein